MNTAPENKAAAAQKQTPKPDPVAEKRKNNVARIEREAKITTRAYELLQEGQKAEGKTPSWAECLKQAEKELKPES